jgi:hypothetical protein
MITVIVGDPIEGFLHFGPYENEEEIEEALRLEYEGKTFWLPLHVPAGAPALSTAKLREKDEAWVVNDKTAARVVGPFSNKAAAAAWFAAHDLGKILEALEVTR